MTLTPGAILLRGTEIQTGADGQIQSTCDDGTSFALGPNSSVFLDNALCTPDSAGSIDLTRGDLEFATAPAPAVVGGLRSAVNAGAKTFRTPVSEVRATSEGASFVLGQDQQGTMGTTSLAVQSGIVELTDVNRGSSASSPRQPGRRHGAGARCRRRRPPGQPVGPGRFARHRLRHDHQRGQDPAIVCKMAPLTSLPAGFSFAATDSQQSDHRCAEYPGHHPGR